MNIKNLKEKKLKKKGEIIMINRINKKSIIILLFVMLFTILVPKDVNAATYNTKSSLYSAGKSAVGNTVRIYRSGSNAQDAFEQDHESSHIYCVQHHVTTTKKYYDYTVKSYIKIEGNVATNSNGKSVTSNKNLALAYLLEKENWKKGYGGYGDEEVRNLAVKHYMTAGGWMASVGNALGLNYDNIDYFNINTSSKSDSKKQKVRDFVNRAISYSNTNANKKTAATIKLTPSSVKPTTMKQLGPIKFTFTGNLQSVKLFNGGSEVKDSKTFTVGGKTKKISQINTGNNVTINKNTENRVTKIEATTKSDSYIQAEMWLCVKSNAKQNLVIVKSSEKNNTATTSIKVADIQKGSLTINKTDKDTGKSIAAGFKIQTSAGKWLSGTNGSYNYNNTFAKAQTYTSSVTLKDLKFDTYKIYEVKAPNGYDLSVQSGYDKNNKWVYFGTATLNSNNVKVTKKYTNMQKISIKGYVWIDEKAPKDDTYNSLYDSARELKVAGVTVKLINKANKKAIATTKTNANGEYVFDKLITKSQLKDYYVEFNYNGVKVGMKDAQGKDYQEDVSKYITVAFNSENANAIKKEGSRAIMDKVAEKDTDLSGIATTYKGTDNKETTYGLSGNIYNKLIEGAVLNNINLGIKKIPTPDYYLSEDLEYVKITIKGYDYKYVYGAQGNKNKVAAPTVNWQKKGTISGYTANIYPSDIAYKSENSEEELKVYVKYRIDIKNTSTLGTGDAASKMNELYKEKTLHISKLTDKFDTKRYKLNDSNWTEKDGTATIKEDYLKDIKNNGIESSKTATKYIEFSVNHDAILDILKNPNGIIEEYPTKVETTGFHKYTRKDYSWQNNISKEQTHITKDDTRNADAPYLIFKLGEERILSGKVFEDKVVTTDGQKLGNGVYDNNENVVQGVKVELLDIKENTTDITKLDVSNLYGVKGEGNSERTAISNKAEVYTDKNGIYTLAGIVPGKYFIRFTYGDGTQKICDISGKEITTLSGINYKSTIVTNEIAKSALKGGKDAEWYKKLGNTNSSVAIDNLDTRIAINAGTSKDIMAGTAMVEITIENTPTNTANIEVSENGEQVKLASNKFEGLNLGVIEQPKQEAKLEKIITNIKLENSQLNKGFSGNPETDTLQGVSDLDNIQNGGSTYVRAELQDEIVSAANLELTYGIKVTNISDVNYYNSEYYWYGEADKNKEVTLVLNELSDYLDKSLNLKVDASDSRFKETTDPAIIQDESISNATIIKLSNWNTKLYTEKNTTRNNNNFKTSDAITLVAYKILSIQDEDMEFINNVEITNLNNGTDDRDNSTDKDSLIKIIKPTIIEGRAQAKATITPPTGADRQTIIIYTIAGAIALAILSTGVVVIKKYIVK